MKLAFHLGMTHGQLLSTISDEEFILWAAFLEMSPAPAERADLNAARLLATITNAMRGKKKAVQPKKFLIDYAAEAMKRANRKRSKRSFMSRLRDVAIAAGATEITPGE